MATALSQAALEAKLQETRRLIAEKWGWFLAVGIVLIVTIGSIIRAKHGIRRDRHGNDYVAGNDAETKALQAEIRRIHREVGSTFVFVTHDQEEAMNLSDRIALFNTGRIEQVGTPEQLYRAPETLFTARFLGDSNVFELDGGATGTSAGWDGETWAVDADTVATHPGVRTRGAVVVRPEDVEIVRSATTA